MNQDIPTEERSERPGSAFSKQPVYQFSYSKTGDGAIQDSGVI